MIAIHKEEGGATCAYEDNIGVAHSAELNVSIVPLTVKERSCP